MSKCKIYVLLLILSSGFTWQVHAVPTTQDFQTFVNAINNDGVILLEDEPETIQFQAEESVVVEGAIIALGACALSVRCMELVDEAFRAAERGVRAGIKRGVGFVSGLFDPQDALLLSSFELDGVDVSDQLVAHAMSPENVLFQSSLPDFLGGSTFTASSAFSGSALDQGGNETDIRVGFGVFQTAAGEDLFTPIAFADTFPDLAELDSIDWDLEPIVPGDFSGSISGEARRLLVGPPGSAVASVPEPGTLVLLIVGLLGLLMIVKSTAVRSVLRVLG